MTNLMLRTLSLTAAFGVMACGVTQTFDVPSESAPGPAAPTTALDPGRFPGATTAPPRGMGDEFALGEPATVADNILGDVDVAVDSRSGTLLAVWRGMRGLMGARFDETGALLDPRGILLAPSTVADILAGDPRVVPAAAGGFDVLWVGPMEHGGEAFTRWNVFHSLHVGADGKAGVGRQDLSSSVGASARLGRDGTAVFEDTRGAVRLHSNTGESGRNLKAQNLVSGTVAYAWGLAGWMEDDGQSAWVVVRWLYSDTEVLRVPVPRRDRFLWMLERPLEIVDLGQGRIAAVWIEEPAPAKRRTIRAVSFNATDPAVAPIPGPIVEIASGATATDWPRISAVAVDGDLFVALRGLIATTEDPTPLAVRLDARTLERRHTLEADASLWANAYGGGTLGAMAMLPSRKVLSFVARRGMLGAEFAAFRGDGRARLLKDSPRATIPGARAAQGHPSAVCTDATCFAAWNEAIDPWGVQGALAWPDGRARAIDPESGALPAKSSTTGGASRLLSLGGAPWLAVAQPGSGGSRVGTRMVRALASGPQPAWSYPAGLIVAATAVGDTVTALVANDVTRAPVHHMVSLTRDGTVLDGPTQGSVGSALATVDDRAVLVSTCSAGLCSSSAARGSAAFTPPAPLPFVPRGPTFALSADGHLVFATTSPTGFTLYALRLDASGAAVGPPVDLGETSGAIGGVTVASAGDEQLVLYSTQPRAGGPYDVFALHLTKSGKGAAVRVASGLVHPQADVASAGRGRWLTTYVRFGTNTGEGGLPFMGVGSSSEVFGRMVYTGPPSLP